VSLVTYDPSISNRFWKKVQKTDGCWLWTGSKDRRGYGRFSVNNFPHLAHRVAKALAHGPFDSNLCGLHKCDNPPCVNPDHIALGTKMDNTRDMLRKGRFVDHHGRKTHCRNGHPYAGENLAVLVTSKTKERRCRQCMNSNKRRYRMIAKLEGRKYS
jgi:hypothetical protein